MKSNLFLLSTLLSCLLLFCHETNAFVVTVTSPSSTARTVTTGILSCSSPLTSRALTWTTTTVTAKKYKYGNASTSTSALFAKKKKNKNKQQQQSGFAWAVSFTLNPCESASLRDLASIACASYEGRTGKPLMEELKKSSDIPKTLWEAPLACVIIGKEEEQVQEKEQKQGEIDNETDTGNSNNRHGNGNIVMYANVAALETVGLRPDQFEQLLAMKDMGSGEWKVPEKVTKFIDLPSSMNGNKGYESGYQKKIIKWGPASTETDLIDIRIENAQRWKLDKNALVDGKFVTETLGVVYVWDSWWEGGDTLCKPGGVRDVDVNLNISDMEDKVKAQGEIIRELKEVQGFGNKDPEVADAVKELLRLKAEYEELVSN